MRGRDIHLQRCRLLSLLLAACVIGSAAPALADPVGLDHWSLQPVQRPDLPRVDREDWPRNPVDHFVLARLEAAGLPPSDEADRRLLIRRLSFDLTGLPPSPDEVEQFIADDRPDAYERLVDRLLASPRYGERWGRHWLDVARYSESHGFERDEGRYNAWPYRDYVIASFNDDKPYDQFVREQIAGDVLEPVTREGVTAAAFLVAGPFDNIGATQQSEAGRAVVRAEEMENLVATVGQSFMGLTVDCARCHDHKNDPISQEDFYRVRAVFDGVRHGERPLGTPEQVEQHQRRQEIREKLDDLRERLAELEDDAADVDNADADKNAAEQGDTLRAHIADAEAELADLPELMAAYLGHREQPEPARFKHRGDADSPAHVVAPAGLSAIEHPSPDFGLDADAPEADRRLAFADWVAHPDHPLTARVMANRVWHYHFGTGIVDTPNDFGGLGGEPSHPQLLDYLADWFVDNGWSVKALHRLIVTSATYRQAPTHRSDAAAIDAENRLLWRYAPRRLEAEAIRDAQLVWSGRMNFQMGGESFQPFELFVRGGSGHYYLLEDPADAEHERRSVYRMNVISGKDPMLDAFDCPDPGARTPSRRTTVTPLQALSLMNNSFVQRQVRYFADRMLDEADGDAHEAVTLAYRHVFGRPPRDEEVDAAIELVDEHGMHELGWVLFNASEALYVR